jgi:cell division protein DivIC
MFTSIKNLFAPIIRNKFLLVFSIFFVWMIFFDNNNLIIRKKMLKEHRQLRSDRKYYTLRIVEDSTRLSELMKDASSLEKFAREKYLMKKDNEDVFVIVK